MDVSRFTDAAVRTGPRKLWVTTAEWYVLTGCSLLTGLLSFSADAPGIAGAMFVLSALMASLTAGALGFTLTVTGNNFLASSVVQWAGATRPTTFVSSTKLQAAVSATDVTHAGTFQISYSNTTQADGNDVVLTTLDPANPILQGTPGNDTFACIRQLESSNNYRAPGGGAYQFTDPTWHGLGQEGSAQDAPPETQDAMAVELQRRRGWSPWTTAAACGAV